MDKALTQIQDNLESIKKVTQDASPTEFWSARELMGILGYVTWRQFSEAIERAKESCKTSDQNVENHFLLAPAKSTGGRPQEDCFLTRYACYLIAQNGDPRKPQIALAQTYFATQTRMTEEVVKNSKATRQTLLSRGIKPENLKAEEDLKRVASRRKLEAKKLIST